ncbi:MAG: polyketide cyclase [Verrucomicrobiaceae bacterium]|nr:MAG: polyketide cyclase [Verrucomicrobiaceae bacterium]
MTAKILIALAVLILVFVIVVASRPADFRYERSTTIAAPPSAVFPHLNDLHKWQAWSPWARKDPNAMETFEGPATGVGSSMSWAGNKDVGEGKMTIIESKPDELVSYRLDFIKPMEGTNVATFTFTPESGQTKVVWSMTGKNTFIFKAFSLFIDCEKMIGNDFEQGLRDLKALVEKPANT